MYADDATIILSHKSLATLYNIFNDELKNIYNNYVYFSVLIQNFAVDAENYYEPFRLGFNNLYDTLDLGTQKKIYYYMKKGIMRDNKNWISEQSDAQELIGVDRSKFDFMTAKSDELSMTYYECNLYFDKITEKFDRRYMKVQELIANLGGLMKAFTFVTALFLKLYNDYFKTLYLINNTVNIYDAKALQTSRTDIFGSNSKSINMSNNYIKPYEDNNKLENSTIIEKKCFEGKPLKISKVNEKKRIELNISYFTILKSYVCTLSPFKKMHLKSYEVGERYLNEKLDIVNYIKLNNKIEKALDVIFNEEQIAELNSNRIIYLSNIQ